jgi:hypothetical protein
VGYVQAEVASASPLREAFFAGLRELGWIDGRNITIDWRRRDEEIADLAGLNPAAVIRRPHQAARGSFCRMAAMADPRRESSTGGSQGFGAPGQYDENGVDLSLIRANMRVSPSERARRAERARRSALRVQAIGRAARAKPA